jgi:hypothetical protein
MELEPVEEAIALIVGSSTIIGGKDISGMVIGQEEKAVVLDGITFRAEADLGGDPHHQGSLAAGRGSLSTSSPPRVRSGPPTGRRSSAVCRC